MWARHWPFHGQRSAETARVFKTATLAIPASKKIQSFKVED